MLARYRRKGRIGQAVPRAFAYEDRCKSGSDGASPYPALLAFHAMHVSCVALCFLVFAEFGEYGEVFESGCVTGGVASGGNVSK